ncbi:MAG: ATP-binding protein [Bacteroidales bacterium]|nr:ATP-binding protein [Bacteroidales bacterium]
MKKFYDRELEMRQLREMQRQAYEDYSRFVVLTGRRRIGKTSLVYRLLEETKAETPGLYFFVGRKAEATLVRTYCEEVRTKLGVFVPEGITSFRNLMQLLFDIGKRRQFTLFIDEFQEFDNVNAGVFSDMQDLWDKYKKVTKVCLIVSGSIFRTMEKIFKDEEQPLFGRDDCTIKLQPFTTTTMREILGDYKADYTNEDLLALWTITGGVARYIEQLMNNHCTNVKKMLHYVCSSGDSYFIEEGKSVLVQEFGKQYGTYFSILDQIAHGDVTQSEIEAALGAKSLGGQLKVLEEKYGIIKKKRPVGAKDGSQTVRYEIQDNFFRFWFRYIHRYASLIEIQNLPALEQIMTEDYPTFSGIALERWFRQKMMESCRYRTIGGWWQSGGVNTKGNSDEFEIDIVAETLDGDIEAYEVKRNPKKYNPARLREKVGMMQRHLYRGREVNMKGLSIDDM